MNTTNVAVTDPPPRSQRATVRRSRFPAGCDVAVLGGGMAGMATALRLQARGLSTVVLEAHGHAGGCAGYYRRRGFSFDVGATTLVDFEPGGVGAELLETVGLQPLEGEALPGYVAWLPDRVVTLYRDQSAWRVERLRALGDSPRHVAFWEFLDRLAEVFWAASRAGVRMPVRRPGDVLHNIHAVGIRNLPLGRHVTSTLGAALRRHGLRQDAPLVGLLSMLVEDTVHSTVDAAPLINAALGVTIRGAGLTRATGGMHGLWRCLVTHYRALGGQLHTGCRVERVDGGIGAFQVHTPRGTVYSNQVVSALPAQATARITAGTPTARRLAPFVERDAHAMGGAILVFLGVPEDEVTGQEFTHHQLLQDYTAPLGDGNNMFVSVSAPGDTVSAPPGHRAVMISTHTELNTWQDLSDEEYREQKTGIGDRLLDLGRRVYPRLGERPVVYQVGTPRTYEHFALRPGGAVGGVRQTLRNTNQHAIPHDLGVPGFWLAGDSTWPGLGTVACVLGSRLVADGVVPYGETIPARHHIGPREDSMTATYPPIPKLADLGPDLLTTTRRQRIVALARPYLGIAAFVAAAWLHWWWLTPIVVFGIFVAVVTVTHDVVHRTLGLTKTQTERALFFLGLVLLESGHAYRATHTQHHRLFPSEEDPEGYPANLGFLGAVCYGPVFLIRLWWWAYRRAVGGRAERAWLIAEASAPFIAIVGGLLFWPVTPAPLAYTFMVIVGSWVYPLLTVYLPHRNYGDNPLTQTHTLRGRIIPAIFLELTYHLEHHLYPQVPSHHLKQLGQRLDPYLKQAGIRPQRVI